MDYLTLAALKERVKTSLPDTALASIISEESAAITLRLGAEPLDPMVEDLVPAGSTIWLTYPAAAITSVLDVAANAVVDPSTYTSVGRVLVTTGTWPKLVRVTYAIANRLTLLSLLEGVCLDLCRLAITDMGGEALEQIGDYRHDAKDVQAERQKVLARLNTLRGIQPGTAR